MKSQTSADVTSEVEEVFEHPALHDEVVQDIKKKSVSGAFSYMTRTIVLYGIGAVSSGILAAYLTTAEFGIYGFVSQIIGLLTFFSDIGFASAIIQKKEEPTLVEYRTVFTIQQILSWSIFLATVLIAVSKVFEPKIGVDGVMVLLALGLSFPLASIKTIPSVMLERYLNFSKLVIPQICEQLVFNGIVVFCAVRGLGVKSYTFAVLARSIVGVVVMLYLQWWPFGFAWDRKAIKEMVGEGAKFQLNDFIARIKDQLFFLTLGWFLPLNEFGYITFAKQWSLMPYQLTVQNVISITFPTYSRLQHDKKLLQKAIEKTLFFITLCIFPLLVGMSVFIFPFMALITKYHKWQPAAMTFVLFTLAIGWSAISTPLTNTLNAIGQINKTLKLMVMWTLLDWGLTPILVHFWGFNGVALATFLISFTSILPIYYVRKTIELNVWESVWRQLFAAIIMGTVGGLLIPVWSRNLLFMFVGMILSGLIYLLFLFGIGREKVLAEVRSLKKK